MLVLRRKLGEWVSITDRNGVSVRATYRMKSGVPFIELSDSGYELFEGEEGTVFGGNVIVKHIFPKNQYDVDFSIVRVGFVGGREYIIARGELANMEGGFLALPVKEAHQPLVPNRSSRSYQHRKPRDL